jgi:hypothetical protein
MIDLELLWKRFAEEVAIDGGLADRGTGGFQMRLEKGAAGVNPQRFKHGNFLGSVAKHKMIFMRAAQQLKDEGKL